jgi:hypothetical protein
VIVRDQTVERLLPNAGGYPQAFRHGRVEKAFGDRAPRMAEPIRNGTGETILVVEDSFAVRKLVANVLSSHGYRVAAAASPSEALERTRECSPRVDLLLADVILPKCRAGLWRIDRRSFLPVKRGRTPTSHDLAPSSYLWIFGTSSTDLALLA